MSSDVRRASHAHHAPHMGLPQIEPVTNVVNVKEAPITAAAVLRRWAILIRQISPIAALKAMKTYMNIDIQADGTCTNMMRYPSPC